MKSALRLLARFVYANALPKDLFTKDVKPARLRQLFGRYVRLVEIENHSYCNRTCSFCPNATLDRLSKIIPLDDQVFGRIIDDLASVNYDQTLVWARYHEPLADESIFPRLTTARKALPKAFLSVTSNGDYLNKDVVHRLEEIGINQMYVSLYLPDGKERDPECIRDAKDKFQRRTGLTYGRQYGEYFWRMDGTKLQMTVSVPDYNHGGTGISSRGGLIAMASTFKDYQRTSVCFSPLHHIVVDYNGKSMLCCQTRSDAPEHQRAIIGEIGKDGYSLFDHFRDLAPARAGLFRAGPKKGVCKSCSQNADGPYKVGRVDAVAGFFRIMPGAEFALNKMLQRSHRQRRYEISEASPV